MDMDHHELASFLRARRDALQPEDVGLQIGPRRRTKGLRREEVSALVGMSPDYYARLERGSGPRPSESMIAAIARGLRLSLAERDHIFRLAGYRTPQHTARRDHVSPGLMRILDRLLDTPAQVMGAVGETLLQTRPAVALLGDQTQYTGPTRSVVYRWFTDPTTRDRYLREDHPLAARAFVEQLRRSAADHGPNSPAADLARTLRTASPEFADLWDDHTIGFVYSDNKRFDHPEVGRLDLFCQTLIDPDQTQSLLIFTATPGSESYEKLALLTILAAQTLSLTSTA